MRINIASPIYTIVTLLMKKAHRWKLYRLYVQGFDCVNDDGYPPYTYKEGCSLAAKYLAQLWTTSPSTIEYLRALRKEEKQGELVLKEADNAFIGLRGETLSGDDVSQGFLFNQGVFEVVHRLLATIRHRRDLVKSGLVKKHPEVIKEFGKTFQFVHA